MPLAITLTVALVEFAWVFAESRKGPHFEVIGGYFAAQMPTEVPAAMPNTQRKRLSCLLYWSGEAGTHCQLAKPAVRLRRGLLEFFS